MLSGKALRFYLFALAVSTTFAALCDFSEGIEGVGEQFSLVDKLSIVGFEAKVSYATLSSDASPFLTILAASEEPAVSSDNGLLTITPAGGECAAPEGNPDSSATMLFSGFFAALMAPHRGMGSLIFLASLASSLGGVYGQDTCKPSLEIEISLPMGAETTSTFGDTDHYLAATVDTVVWGYYDPNATSKITMESGETITVEVITHHSGQDYAKMIRGDPAVEEVFAWEIGQSLTEKNEPKLPGSGVHLITGPIEVVGAEVGDVVQIEILELDPRLNPATGKCYGTNSQKFAGYHWREGTMRDGTPYTRDGGTEAITVFEFVQTDSGAMAWGKPVYMYTFPNMTLPDGSVHTFDSNPSVMIPHEYNLGYNGELLEEEPIEYPEGFDGFAVTDEGGIKYLSPDMAQLDWKVPLRPHLGTLAVMPNNTVEYIDESAPGGANTIPPSRFGGNVDDWRIGKGGTMYYTVEVPGAQILVGDTHAAQGDAELAGTAMETSMTTKLRVTLHKKDSLPIAVQDLNFPLLETSDQWVVHGFAYQNYLDTLEDPSDIFAEGASLDLAMSDCFIKTRNWLMDTMDLLEEETIAMMATAIDFGITQVVDGNWGVHADIDKWIFDDSDTPYDYSCTTSKSPGRRALLKGDDRRLILEEHGVKVAPEEYADKLYAKVTEKAGCATCANHHARNRVADKMLDAKLKFAKKMKLANGLK